MSYGRSLLAASAVALTACSEEPDFDDEATSTSTSTSTASAVATDGASSSDVSTGVASGSGGDDGSSSGGGEGGAVGDGGAGDTGGSGGGGTCGACEPGTLCDEASGSCEPCPLWTRRFAQNIFSLTTSADGASVYAVSYGGAIEKLDACTGETLADVPQSAESFYLKQAGRAGDRLLTFGDLGGDIVRRGYGLPGLEVQGSTVVGTDSEILYGFDGTSDGESIVAGSAASAADSTGFVLVDGASSCRETWVTNGFRPTGVAIVGTEVVYAIKSEGNPASLARGALAPCLASCDCEPGEVAGPTALPVGVELTQLLHHSLGYMVAAGNEFDGVGGVIALFNEESLDVVNSVSYAPTDSGRDLVESIELYGNAELLVGATQQYPVGTGEWLIYGIGLGVVDSASIGTEVVGAHVALGGIIVGGTAEDDSNGGPGFVARCTRDDGCPVP